MLSSVVRDYVENFKVALAFAVLLVFFLPFSYLTSSYPSSASVLLDFNILFASPITIALEIAALMLFLLAYAFLTTLAVFAVKREISKASVGRYLALGMQKYAFKYFLFAFAFTLTLTILSSIAAILQAPLYIIPLATFLLSIPFFFLPQAMVIEEIKLRTAISASIEFILRNPFALIYTLSLGTVFAIILPAIELLFDTMQIGKFVSLLIALVVAVPFIEFFKSEIYMRRFELVKSSRTVPEITKPIRGKLVIKDITLQRQAKAKEQ